MKDEHYHSVQDAQDGGREGRFPRRENPMNGGRKPRPRITRSNRSADGGTPFEGYQPVERRPRFGYGGNHGERPFRQGHGHYQPRRTFGAMGDADSDNFEPSFRRTGGFQSRGGGYQSGYDRNRQQRPSGFKPRSKYSLKKRLDYKEEHIDPNAPIRLNKYLANAGICSRRDADKYIEAGVVTVNGVVVKELGTKVLRSDHVVFHDAPVKLEKKVYVLLNKPKGYVTTSDDPQNRKTVMDLVRNACPERIYPVGRLDRGTTGVLLLTNDGELATKLTHPQYLKKKIYHVHLDKNLTATDLRQIAAGITLEDGEIKVDDVQYASVEDKKQVGVELHSGRNRIVRRIFESLGYNVLKLDRVYFAGLTKKNVRRGDWRYLTQEEVNMLQMGAFE